MLPYIAAPWILWVMESMWIILWTIFQIRMGKNEQRRHHKQLLVPKSQPVSLRLFLHHLPSGIEAMAISLVMTNSLRTEAMAIYSWYNHFKNGDFSMIFHRLPIDYPSKMLMFPMIFHCFFVCLPEAGAAPDHNLTTINIRIPSRCILWTIRLCCTSRVFETMCIPMEYLDHLGSGKTEFNIC